MDLPTAEVDVDQAKQAAKDYREAVRTSRSEEDRMLATAYKAAAEGAQLLNLSEALRAAGSYELGLRGRGQVMVPHLAIAPADLDFIWTNGIRQDGSLDLQHRRAISSRNEKDVHRLAAGTFEPSAHHPTSSWSGNSYLQCSCRITAMVPIVPPPLRPADSLAHYTMLWEADWQDVGDPPPPPGDPALLRHLGGDMYAVLAVWDLTEIERAVLAGRRVPAE